MYNDDAYDTAYSHKEYVVYLRDEKKLSYPEIANELGKDKEAVRSMYRRAKGTHTKRMPQRIYSSHNIMTDERIRIAFPTDMHVPFHDVYAVELAKIIVYNFQPDILVCGSDAIDFYSVSAFDKDPDRRDRLQEEIDEWIEIQEEFNALVPHASKKYIVGNHEDRLRRYLWRHAEIADLRALKLENLLELSALGIEFVGDEIVVNDVLVIKHGSRVRKESAYAARAELESERYSINIMSAHTHRGGSHFATSRRGVYRADECFCLCDLHPDYVKNPNWQQGITIATVVGKHVHVEPIPFFGKGADMVAFWRGKMYNLDYIQDIT